MAHPGTIASKTLTNRYAATCGICKIPFVRDLRSMQEFHNHLQHYGWVHTSLAGWVCGTCMDGRKRLTEDYETPKLGKLLAHLKGGGEWAPTKIAREYGITRQHVYWMRNKLVSLGLIASPNGESADE